MLDLGTVRPGSTIRIPFNSADKDDGSSITMTNYAVGDILVYKDGNTTERASTSGFTATTDFDGKTAKHLAIIDLADNTTAGFFAAGSEYLVAIDSVTIDGVTAGGWIARFRIGYDAAMLDTTIATLSSQTSFTLTSGPAEDDALNGAWAIIHDVASGVQKSLALIDDYTGSTKTVTLAAGATFTVAASDNISVMFPAPLQPVTVGRKLAVDSSSRVDVGLIEGTDATNQIRDSVVDDATRIDASALNTLSSHDPGEAIMGATDLGTGAGFTSLATSAELAKVPKSDSTVGWNATARAQIQTEVEDGLAAYDPPTRAEATTDKNAILTVLGTPADTDIATDIANLDTGGGGGPTASQIADAVWEEALADHEGTAGSVAEALADAGGSGASAADIADAVLDEALSGHTTSGTLGKAIADIDSHTDTETGAAAIRAALGMSSANLDTLLAAIQADTDNLQTRVPAALTSNGNLKVSLQEILTTALTEASTGQLSAAFKKWFDVASPVGTVNSIPNATAGASGGLALVGSAQTLATDSVDAAALKTDAVTEIVTAFFARTMAAAFNSLTTDQVLRVLLAAAAGKVSGLDTGHPLFRNFADSGTVIDATTDVDGNRSAVTITP